VKTWCASRAMSSRNLWKGYSMRLQLSKQHEAYIV
jgi:hypothetical protein